MKIKLIAVGNKMPAWVEAAVEEYRKRLPHDFSLSVTEVSPAPRTKNTDTAQAMEKEAQGILRALDRNDFVVALEVGGRQLSTEALAGELDRLRMQGSNLALLVGGADGLAPSCLEAANSQWSLSALTFPHPLVRAIVAEQLYRAWSILQGHPYHRS